MTDDPSEPSRLLKDLESIRTLLDEQPEAGPIPDTEEAVPPELDIPLLQDVIIDPTTITATIEETAVQPPTALARPHNPFLPYDSLARLAEERMQLDRLMAGHIPPPRESVHHGAREVRLEARLHAEAQLILQGVIDDLIPTIEAELRNRLRGKLEQIVREQLK